MKQQLELSDIIWDGAHFSASTPVGTIEGAGIFTPNEACTGGVLLGRIARGPAHLLSQYIHITFVGEHGIGTTP